jgi:threonylcarbamoyladenosine tRNA methylthiotransferase MtaB
MGERTRSFLKVQDGCDYSCSFCTIPLARGASRSDAIANLVESAEKIGKSGVKEIVLSGVNIGDFGKGTPVSLLDLIKALDQVESVERFRISSIEPNLLTNEIIEFVANSKRFMPHFHIPLQSGSDKILKRMKRRYLRKLYSDRVTAIKNLIPHCCIGVDVIVGFPGETSEDFLDTYNFLNKLDISYLHVFSYSERENTKAIKMDGVVPKRERAERSKSLHQLSDKKRRSFYREFENTRATILFESINEDGTINGFTENYIKVKTNHKKGMEGVLLKRSLGRLDQDGLMLIEPVNTAINAHNNNLSFSLS